MSSPPLVIAHAGGEGVGPSNTIEAMQRSVAAGADILDVDLRMTSDGMIIARHDRDVASTTDGTGNVDELAWADVQRLDAAARWTGEPFPAPVRVPTLEQVLTGFPETPMSLELKQSEPSMAVELCTVLRRTGRATDVYLSANDDSAVYAARDVCPEVLLITTTYADLDRMRAADESEQEWCAVSPIGQPPYRADRFDQQQVEIAHRRGMALFTWTVDDPEVMRTLAEVGVDGVYTSRPDLARAAFDAWADEHGATG
ncbi:MAG: glycerophosphodiester phosphodiesterase family protein [Ilumatobacteraceae bacterium]